MSETEKQIKTEDLMGELGRGIGSLLNEFAPEMGFALIVFEFNRPGLSNYVSSAERESMIEALKETVKRLEKKQDIPAAKTRTVQ